MGEKAKTALVTGAGRGIGQAIAIEQAKRNRDIVIADLDQEEMAETKEQIEGLGQRALCLHTDVRDDRSIAETVDKARETFGSIDVLVNNSGISGPTLPCDDMPIEEWDETISVNLRGAFLMCRAVLPIMKRQEFGRIVNIASVTGKRPVPERTPYAASKMGIIGFTRSLAAEVGDRDINANVVCPGSVEGPRIERVFRRHAEAKGVTSQEVKKREMNRSARDELVDRQNVARVVAFLSSDDAAQMTGQDLNVSAGKVMY